MSLPDRLYIYLHISPAARTIWQMWQSGKQMIFMREEKIYIYRVSQKKKPLIPQIAVLKFFFLHSVFLKGVKKNSTTPKTDFLKKLYFYFNLPGHIQADLTVTILEQKRNNKQDYRREREKCFIRRLYTFNQGIHKEW